MNAYVEVLTDCSSSGAGPESRKGCDGGETVTSAPDSPVIEAGPNRWFVASKSIPGAYWLVERSLIDYEHTSQWETSCPCPWGFSQLARPYHDRIACRHLKLLVKHQNAAMRRPVSPPNISALCD